MRTSRLTARIAATGLHQQVKAIRQSEDLGAASDRLIDQFWRDLNAILHQYAGPQAWLHIPRAQHAVYALLLRLDSHLRHLFDARLAATALAAHAHAADSLVAHLPPPALHGTATEDEASPPPGFVGFGISPIGTLVPRNFAAPLANPNISKAAKRDLLKQLVFPPPPAKLVRDVVYRGDWFQRLSDMTKLAAPEDIAKVIRQGFTAGKSMRDMARDLRPVVDGVRSSANRIARNETLRVSHQMQWDAWQEVDELIAGYQVHAVDNGHNPTSRPEHRARNGTIYWKLPKSGQESMMDCPHPPQESPRMGNATAQNCRCWLTPVFAPVEKWPPLDQPAPHPIDSEVATDWFDSALVRDRKAAVGSERYNLARSILDRPPTWLDFIDLATGALLSPDQLQTKLMGAVGLLLRR